MEQMYLELIGKSAAKLSQRMEHLLLASYPIILGV